MMAGGDILTVTPYEIEDILAAEVVPVVVPAPAPAPVVVQEAVKIPMEPAVVAAVAPLAAASVSPFYIGLGLAAAQYDTNCGCVGDKSGKDKTLGAMARVGYDFNKYMGIEARGMYTPAKENGGKVKHYGAFLKPMYPVTDGLNVYGLGGIAKTKTIGTLRKTDVSGLAFGAGLEYDLSSDKKKEATYDRTFDGIADQEKGLGLFADYEKLYYKSGAPKLDAVSVGVTYDF
jgi:OOP family OmpA-OmpF porin